MYEYVLDDTLSPAEVAQRIISDGRWTADITAALAQLCYLDETLGDDGTLVPIFPQLVSSDVEVPPVDTLEVYVHCCRYI